ncbi:MAG: NAD-dependent epimerase/dehydratase family protein [Elusimicrobia bacterium]|nr:NAD-dependent epimerase/dehydratase family protein [Elusimicrobiota bacterium]
MIGGTRFIGHHCVERLLKEGHDVTLLHRGVSPSAFAGSVREILGDRSRPEGWAALPEGERWDLALDTCAYRPSDSEAAVQALRGRVGRFVHVSTGQVYLVLEPVPNPAREYDYEGKLSPTPPPGPDRDAWQYGVDKRDCEDFLRRAFESGFPVTVLRLPVVQGPRDPKRRLEAYVAALLAGRPLRLTEADRSRPIRHLYVGDVASCVAGLLKTRRGLGRAFNLSMEEADVTLPALLEEAARALGREARFAWAEVDEAAGSPLSGTWVSFVDPARAKEELGFCASPWRDWVRETARWTASALSGSAGAPDRS